MDTSHQGANVAQNEGSKLPPVLANLMGNLNNNSRSPQTNAVNNPVTPAVNVQELLSSIMVRDLPAVRSSFGRLLKPFGESKAFGMGFEHQWSWFMWTH